MLIDEPILINFLGICGSRKSTLARAVAKVLSAAYLDTDKYHVESARQKLNRSEPLTAAERDEWIRRCQDAIAAALSRGQTVVADASLLRREHRDRFRKVFRTKFLFLHTPRDVALARTLLRAKTDPTHELQGNLEQFVDDQLAKLEYPFGESDVTMIDGRLDQSQILQLVYASLGITYEPSLTKRNKRRIVFCASGYHAQAFLSRALDRDVCPWLTVVGIIRDDPNHPCCNAAKRAWQHLDTERLPALVDPLAREHNVPVYTASLKDPKFLRTFQQTWKPDLIVSSFFGQRIARSYRAIAGTASLNLHAAWGTEWPRNPFGGADATKRILDDQRTRYIHHAFHHLDDSFDHGRLVNWSPKFQISAGDTVDSAMKRTSPMLAEFLVEQLKYIIDDADAHQRSA